MQKVYLLTTNPSKVCAAQSAFDGYPFELVSYDHSYEIQGMNCKEIAQEAAIRIAKRDGIITIREDHALYIDGMFGDAFPGPYTAYFDKMCHVEDWIHMIFPNSDVEKLESKSGYFEIGTCIAFPDGVYRSLVTQVPVELIPIPSGNRGNIDKILRIPGESDTFSSAPPGTYTHLFTHNLRDIAQHLSQR